MKKLSYILMALVLVLGLAQCKKEQPQPQGKKVYITLKVDDGAKHTVDPENGTVTYADGDVIYVGNGSNFIGYLTCSGSVFGGTIDVTGMVENTSYLHFYFAGGAGPDPTGLTTSTTDFTVNISDQSSQLPVLSYTSAEYVGATAYNCKLLNQCALVELTLTSGTTAAVGIGDRYTKATINFGGTPGIAPNTSTTGMITMKSGSETKKYAIMLPQAATDGAHIAIGPEGYTLDIPAIENNGFAKLSNSSAVASNIVYLNYLTADYTATNGQTLTGTLGANVKVSIADDATVTLDGVTINGTNNSSYAWAGLNCNGDATIILKDGTTNTVKGFYEDYPGIHVPSGSTLIIKGETSGTGELYASSNDDTNNSGAGIGGGWNLACGNIEIRSGVIHATGSTCAAGIGSNNQACGNITISGGTVTATGGYNAAGIGSGHSGNCGTITISGGTVASTGGNSGAGIGSGRNGSCGAITIESTVTSVTATKGDGSTYSIGAGYSGTCGTVTIGGVVGAITTSPYTYEPLPEGALSGKFTINGSGGKVRFSQGNLKYSNGTWSFHTNQYDRCFTSEGDVTSYYDDLGTIDLFGWGTSGYPHGANASDPYSTSTNNMDYYAYGSATANLYDGNGKADWGYNAISNGGNAVNQWRTLTTAEWVYLFNNHTKGWSTVNGVNGYVIRPDGVSTAVASSYTASEWATQEADGSVFLPAAGYRNATWLYDVGSVGYYWSSSYSTYYFVYYEFFDSKGVYRGDSGTRYVGYSVRLVRDAN